ncbi:MAG: GGDEF domain-containing protein [Thermoanaerobaculales bacterium]|nr:GGDEF domain-containing protein [Thermoanaerobaculales bacterium]
MTLQRWWILLWVVALTQSPARAYAVNLSAMPEVEVAWVAALGAIVIALALMWRNHRLHKRLELGMEEMERTVREMTFKFSEQTAALEGAGNQLEHQRQTIEELRLTDPLTGLWNRQHLSQTLVGIAAQSLRTWVAWNKGVTTNHPENSDLLCFMVDLDNLREAKASLGAELGDNVLREFADVLRATSRTTDVLARWGGGEILVIRASADRTSARELAERLRTAVATHVFCPGGSVEFSTTCSVGFACYPFLTHEPGALGWEDVIGLAEAALYTAKRTDRNEWVGLIGDAATPSEGLPDLLKNGPADLIERDRLRVVSSFTEGTELKWE